MPIKTVFRNTNQKSFKSPAVIKWKDAEMLISHSLTNAAKEIINDVETKDVIKINLVATPGTGKTTLAESLAHCIHTSTKIPFSFSIFDKKDLIDFEKTLSKLKPVNHILFFDDVSFLSADHSGKKIKKIEQAFTEIRHLEGGRDVKIICIFAFHYTVAVSKYLRQSDFLFYLDAGSSDKDNLKTLVGSSNAKKVDKFQKIALQARKLKKFRIRINAKGRYFTYDYREPFAPVLFYNEVNCRVKVFPKREWIDPNCITCNNSRSSSNFRKIPKKETLEEFDKKIQTTLGVYSIKEALKTLLMLQGIFTQKPRVKRAQKFIETWIRENDISLMDLANFYNLSDNPNMGSPKRLTVDKILKDHSS